MMVIHDNSSRSLFAYQRSADDGLVYLQIAAVNVRLRAVRSNNYSSATLFSVDRRTVY